MRRRVTWLLLLAFLLTPVLGSVSLSARVSAQDAATAEATDPTVEATPTDETTPEITPTDGPTETPTDVVSPTPTDPPTETVTPSETPTETPTDIASPTPTATATETAAASPVVEPAGVVSPSDITVTLLRCNIAPESFRVTNNGTANVVLTGIETLVDKLPGEPFALTRTLKPGVTALFTAGPTAQYGTVLSSSFIFTDSAYDKDGVVVHTSVGDVTQSCAPKPDPWVSNPGKLSDLKIVLSCRANAESIRVTNNGSGYILLKGLATYYDPIAAEPFSLNRVLKPGQGALYQAGNGAKYGTILTKRYIFTNSVWDKDGVRIATSAGKAYQACDPKPAPPEHWVEVNLSMQYLWAYEGDKVVNQTYVSTGKAGFETPTGTFYILVKYLYDDMEGTIGGEYYNVPAVPWTMYFTNYGHALHGAYWHNDFGTPRSHGCVNLPLPFAEWLYYWLPYGGRVVIHY